MESAIGRRLLGRGDRSEPWTVVSAMFASMFDDHTIDTGLSHEYSRRRRWLLGRSRSGYTIQFGLVLSKLGRGELELRRLQYSKPHRRGNRRPVRHH